jgi:predicted DNA-binding protein (UPF0251 family)
MAVKRFDLSESDTDTWGFLCECGASECEEWVTLSVPDYEALRNADRPILAPGHALVRQQRSRRTARRLVEEAQALRAQAELQLKRAARNLRNAPPD